MISPVINKWRARLRRKPSTLNPKEAYALWAPTYAPRAHNPLMELEQRAMLELMPDLTGQAVLDLACGSGRYLDLIMARAASLVLGLDLSRHMLARVQKKLCPLIQADLRWLPLANSSFNVVVCGLAIGHVENLSSVMHEIGRVLKPNGVVVYSDFHPLGSLMGWKRTFGAADGRQYTVRHHAHLYADHHTACRAAGLAIEELREPVIDFSHKWQSYPAVLVIRARKITMLENRE